MNRLIQIKRNIDAAIKTGDLSLIKQQVSQLDEYIKINSSNYECTWESVGLPKCEAICIECKVLESNR